MSQADVESYSRRINQTRVSASAATCDEARQAHEALATAYSKRLAVIGEVPIAAE